MAEEPRKLDPALTVELLGFGGVECSGTLPIDVADQGLMWKYEDMPPSRYGQPSHYHIYPYTSPANIMLRAIHLDFPQTPENDEDVQRIVAALQRLVRRQREESQ